MRIRSAFARKISPEKKVQATILEKGQSKKDRNRVF